MRRKPGYPLYIRIISIVLLVTFLSYDITWAYPRDTYASSDTLAPRTILTSSDIEQRAQVAAKYIREAVARRFGLLPLVGVEEQLGHICDMFSSLSGVQISTEGSSFGNEIFLRFSDDVVMRFFDLNKSDELGACKGEVIEEFPINQTVGYQLLKSSSIDLDHEKETARFVIPSNEAQASPQDNDETIARYREHIDELINELKAVSERQKPHNSGDKRYFELNLKQRIFGFFAGMAAGSIYLSFNLGASSVLISAVMSVVTLFAGWYIHEKGHAKGARYGRFMRERGGPLASLMLTIGSLGLLLSTAFIPSYTFQILSGFFLVSAASALTHTFADDMVLYKRSDRFMARFRLDKMLMLGFELMCDTPDTQEAEKELFGRIGSIFKETAPIADLRDQRKLLVQNLIVTNINPIGSDSRNSICQDVVSSMLEDSDPNVWEPMLEVIVEDMAMMRDLKNERFFDLFYHVLVKSERLTNFVDAMVKVYVEAHSGDFHTMEIAQKQYLKQIEDLFRRIDIEDPLMGERLFEGISKYTGAEWSANIDSQHLERAWRRTFVNALESTENFIIKDKYKAKQFCINYFHMTLEKCLLQQEDERRIEEIEEGYMINKHGILFLINRARFGERLGRGGLSYAEILELTSKYIPGAIQDLKADVNKEMVIPEGLDGPFTPEQWYYLLGRNTDKLLVKLNAILGAFSSLVNVKINSAQMHGDEMKPRVAELAEAKDSMLQIIMEIARTREHLPLDMPEGSSFTEVEREVMDRTSRSIMDLVQELHMLMGRVRRKDLLPLVSDGTKWSETMIAAAMQDLSLGYVRTANFIRTGGDVTASGMAVTFDLNKNIKLAKAGAGLMNGRIDLDLAECTLPVKGDELLLYEVWDNLISNARKSYHDLKGPITIRTYLDVEEDDVVVEFVDEGRGIKKKELNEIFETNYTTSQKAGKSIGLHWSKEIIEVLGGAIEIDSTVNKGTTVKVRFPASDPEEMVSESLSQLYLRDFRYPASLYEAFEVYEEKFPILVVDKFSATEYRRLRQERTNGEISYATAIKELDALAGIGLLEADRSDDKTVYFIPGSLVNMPPERFELIRLLVGDVSGCPDEDYIKNVRLILQRIKSEYGWELVDQILVQTPQNYKDIKELQRRAMALYNEGALDGDEKDIYMLKVHAIGSARLTSRVITIADLIGGDNELIEEALRLAAIAHGLGKGISSKKLELHLSDKYKFHMTPEDQKALMQYSRDTLCVLRDEGLQIPPVTLLAMFLDYSDDLRECFKGVNPSLFKKIAIFIAADEFRSLTEPRPYERDMWLETPDDIEQWLETKVFDGLIDEKDIVKLKQMFLEEMKTAKGSSFRAFGHIREAFGIDQFGFDDFKKVRIELQEKETFALQEDDAENSQEDVRGDTTFRSELRALVWLGILDVKNDGKKKRYILKDIYARGPPEMISEVNVLLRIIAPTATKDQHLLYAKMLESIVKRHAYKDIAEKLKGYNEADDLKEILRAIKLFWGSGFPDTEEKNKIRGLLDTEEERAKFDSTLGSMARKKIKRNRLYVADMLEALVHDTSAGRSIPEDALERSLMKDEVANRIRGFDHIAVDLAKDLTLFRNKANDEAMARRASGIYSAIISLPQQMRWVSGLYFGYRVAFDKEFAPGRFTPTETIDSIIEAKDKFFELLPEGVRDEVLKEYEDYKNETYSEALTEEENELAFLGFVSTLWYPHTIFYGLESDDIEEEEDLSYLLEVTSQSGRRKELVKERLSKALDYLKKGNFKKAREWAGIKVHYKYVSSPEGRRYARRSSNPESKAMLFHIGRVEAAKKNEKDALSLRILDMYLRDDLSVYDIAEKLELKAQDVRQDLRVSLRNIKYAMPYSLRVKMIRDGVEEIYISAINGVPSVEIEEKLSSEYNEADGLLDKYEKLFREKRISRSSFEWLVARFHAFMHHQIERVRFALKGYIKLPFMTAKLLGDSDVFVRAVPEEGRLEIWSVEAKTASARQALSYYASKINISKADEEDASGSSSGALFAVAPFLVMDSVALTLTSIVAGIFSAYLVGINIFAIFKGLSAEKHLIEYMEKVKDRPDNDFSKIRKTYGVEYKYWNETISIFPGVRLFAIEDNKGGYRLETRTNRSSLSKINWPALAFFKVRAFLRARRKRRKRLEEKTVIFKKPPKEIVVETEYEKRHYRQLSAASRTLVHEIENLMIGFNGIIAQMDHQKVKPSNEFREITDEITTTFNRLKAKSDALARLVAGVDLESAKMPTSSPPPTKEELHKGILHITGELMFLLEEAGSIDIQKEFDKMGELYSEMGGFAIKSLVLAYYKTASYIKSRGGIDPRGEAYPMSVNTSVRMAYEILKHKNISSMGFNVLLDLDDVPAVTADGLLMLEVILNLMKNSLESMSDRGKNGGTLRVSTEYDRSKERVVVTIEDEGLGIPESQQDDIFDPYFTTKGESGTGLGLVVCRDIVQAARGAIRFNSVLGKGTTFVIELPALGEEVEPEVGVVGSLLESFSEEDHVKKSKGPKGDIIHAFDDILADNYLREESFTKKEFAAKRSTQRGDGASDKTVSQELNALVALGILIEDRTNAAYKYRFNERSLRGPPGSLRKIRVILGELSSLSADPDLKAITAAKERLNEEVYSHGAVSAPIVKNNRLHILHLIDKISELDIELIGLSAQRASCEHDIKLNGPTSDKEKKLYNIKYRLRDLKRDIRKEMQFFMLPEYPLYVTGGRDYRTEAGAKMRQALRLIDKKNEPAACASMCAALNLLSKELELLSKFGRRGFRTRTWVDSKSEMVRVMKGQHHLERTPEGLVVNIKEQKPSGSENIWQAIRARDRETDSNLDELDWIRGFMPRLDAVLDGLAEKKRSLPGSRKEKGYQIEISEQETDEILEVLKDLSDKYKRAKKEEKKLALRADHIAKNLLDIGENRAVLEILSYAKSLINSRKVSLENQVQNTTSGRLKALRKMIHSRNSYLVYKAETIDSLLAEGRHQDAVNWIYGILTDKTVNNITREPEFHRMNRVLAHAVDMISQGRIYKARKDIRIFKESVRLAEVLNSFMQDLRDEYVDMRLSGAHQRVYDSIFNSKFNQYLEFAKENNIGRGSPRLLWTIFYQAAYLSMKMPDPEKISKKIPSPLFEAFSEFIRMLEVNSTRALAKSIEHTSSSKYSNLLSALNALSERGLVHFGYLDPPDYVEILSALAEDLELTKQQTDELMKCAFIDDDARQFTDMETLEVYWKDIAERYEFDVQAGRTGGVRAGVFEDLFDLSLHPELWPDKFEEDWEEAFIEEISALSADDLIEKFLSYYSPLHRDMKSFRNVEDALEGPSTLQDIHGNISMDYMSPRILEKYGKSLKEQNWLLIEWIYRHWSSSPKERSYSRIKRLEESARDLQYEVDLPAIEEVPFDGQRQGTMYLNQGDLGHLLVPENLKAIKEAVSSNGFYRQNKRAATIDLPLPILVNGRIWNRVYIKGIVFDQTSELLLHEGDDAHGFSDYRMEVDAEGRFYYPGAMSAPYGAMGFELARDEFLNHYSMYHNLGLQAQNVFVSAPLGYGVFPNAPKHRGKALGFVLLGMDANMPKRRIHSAEYIETAARTLRALHEEGYVHPYLHLGNLSANRANIYVHDLDSVKRLEPTEENYKEIMTSQMRDLFYLFSKYVGELTEGHDPVTGRITIDKDAFWYGQIRGLVRGYFHFLEEEEQEALIDSMLRSFDIFGEMYYVDNIKEIGFREFMSLNREVANLLHRNLKRRMNMHERKRSGGPLLAVIPLFANENLKIGILLAALGLTGIALLAHEALRQARSAGKFDGFIDKNPRAGSVLEWMLSKRLVPKVLSDFVAGLFSAKEEYRALGEHEDLYRSIPEKDPNYAAQIIDSYYFGASQAEEISDFKICENGAHFAASSTDLIVKISEEFLNKDSKVVDLGSGNGQAAAIFAQFAESVRAVELDEGLHKEALYAYEGLTPRIDTSNVELVNGDLLKEDLSAYDLAYIYWPFVDLPEFRETLADNLRKMKRGTIFVCNLEQMDKDLKGFDRLNNPEGIPPHVYIYQKKTGGRGYDLGYDEELVDVSREPRYIDVKSDEPDKLINQLALELEEITYVLDGSEMPWLTQNMMTLAYTLERLKYFGKGAIEEYASRGEMQRKFVKIAEARDWRQRVGAIVTHIVDPANRADYGDIGARLTKFMDLHGKGGIESIISEYEWLFEPATIEAVQYGMINRLIDRTVLDGDIPVEEAMEMLEAYPADFVDIVLIRLRKVVSSNENKDVVNIAEQFLEEYKEAIRSQQNKRSAKSVDIEKTISDITTLLKTIAYKNGKIILAIDHELGSGWTKNDLEDIVRELSRISRRDDELGMMIRNVVIRSGDSKSLARDITSLTSRGGIKKENIIVVTNERNLEDFSAFKGTATITGINDRFWKEGFYYPMTEVIRFTIAMSLAKVVDVDRDILMGYLRGIPNMEDLNDDEMWELCWDEDAGTYRTTFVIKIIPNAVKVPDKGIYKRIEDYIRTNA